MILRTLQKTYKMTRSKIGARITAIREAQGLTLWKAAKLAGIDQRQLEGIEDGSTAYTIDILLKVCKVLKVKGINFEV